VWAFFVGDFMAIQTINLTVPGGDTPRSANTKINANFSNQTHAASKLVGTGEEQVPLSKDVFTAAYINSLKTYNGAQSDLDSLNYYPLGSRVSLYYSPALVKNPVAGLDVGRVIVETVPLYYGAIQTVISPSKVLWRTTSSTSSLAWSAWYENYSTRNVTKDSNGFLKAASPIVKVFADKAELNDDAVNQNVTYKKNGVGDYTITTVSGLSTDGWYIELPKDMNGNPKVAIGTLVDNDGVITLKTYKRMFSMKTFTFEPDLDNPLDIPDGRWIDLRLNEIPAEEENL